MLLASAKIPPNPWWIQRKFQILATLPDAFGDSGVIEMLAVFGLDEDDI